MPIRILFIFMMICGLAAPRAWSQEGPAAPRDSAHFFVPKPAGWSTEEFPLPPGFAPEFSFTGVEEIRFAPGWAKTGNEQYWSYAYLWWLEGSPTVDTATLHRNLKVYYDGLFRANVPVIDKSYPPIVNVRKVKTASGDKATFAGTVMMLNYLDKTHRSIKLNVAVHVLNCDAAGHTPLFLELSPQPVSHSVWQQFAEIRKGVRCGK